MNKDATAALLAASVIAGMALDGLPTAKEKPYSVTRRAKPGAFKVQPVRLSKKARKRLERKNQ